MLAYRSEDAGLKVCAVVDPLKGIIGARNIGAASPPGELS